MKKEQYIEDLKDIKTMTGQIRSINEAIQFGEDFDDEVDFEDTPTEEPAGDECADGECGLEKVATEEPDEERGLEETGEVDQIREIALRGMIKLCKNPQDERYLALKKIFQFCDKAAEPKDVEEK